MFIKTIEWLDSDNKEAELKISDGLYTLIAFCYPCSYFIGQNSLEPLECLNAHDIASAKLDKYNIIKNSSKNVLHFWRSGHIYQNWGDKTEAEISLKME